MWSTRPFCSWLRTTQVSERSIDGSSKRIAHGWGWAAPTPPIPAGIWRRTTGAVCGVQRCVICRHGIIFRDAFEGLANRHADLWWVRGHTPPERWLTSTLSWEMEAIELVRDRVFAAKVTEFNARS
jgi:hypothetical protein